MPSTNIKSGRTSLASSIASKSAQIENRAWHAFRDFYVALVNDRTWPILTLGFKLFALRHPDSKERLRKAFEMSKATNDEIYVRVFGHLTKNQKSDNDLALLTLGPIVSSLILESHFEPRNLSEKFLRRILGRIFDALFPGNR